MPVSQESSPSLPTPSALLSEKPERFSQALLALVAQGSSAPPDLIGLVLRRFRPKQREEREMKILLSRFSGQPSVLTAWMGGYLRFLHQLTSLSSPKMRFFGLDLLSSFFEYLPSFPPLGDCEAVVRSALATGLQDASDKHRALACRLCAKAGALALPLIPLLLRKLYEGEARIASQAHQALRALCPPLSSEAQPLLNELLSRCKEEAWSKPPTSANEELSLCLESPLLSEAVLRAFASLCAERAAWLLFQAKQPSAARATPIVSAAALSSPREAAIQAAQQAQVLARDFHPNQRRLPSERSSLEAVWQIARLFVILVSDPPPRASQPPPFGKIS